MLSKIFQVPSKCVSSLDSHQVSYFYVYNKQTITAPIFTFYLDINHVIPF